MRIRFLLRIVAGRGRELAGVHADDGGDLVVVVGPTGYLSPF
jgi:hypothetical protein